MGPTNDAPLPPAAGDRAARRLGRARPRPSAPPAARRGQDRPLEGPLPVAPARPSRPSAAGLEWTAHGGREPRDPPRPRGRPPELVSPHRARPLPGRAVPPAEPDARPGPRARRDPAGRARLRGDPDLVQRDGVDRGAAPVALLPARLAPRRRDEQVGAERTGAARHAGGLPAPGGGGGRYPGPRDGARAQLRQPAARVLPEAGRGRPHLGPGRPAGGLRAVLDYRTGRPDVPADRPPGPVDVVVPVYG